MATYDFETRSADYEEMTHTPGADVAKGEFVTLDDTHGFYMVATLSGKKATVIYKSKKTLVDKTTGQAWNIGDAVYWAAGTGKVTNVAGADILIGHAIAAAASADTDGYIHFDGRAAFLKA